MIEADLEKDLRPMTPAEAAKWLRLTDFGYGDDAKAEEAIRRWASAGKIPHTFIGNQIAFTQAHLIAYLDQRTVGIRQKKESPETKQEPMENMRAGVGLGEPPVSLRRGVRNKLHLTYDTKEKSNGESSAVVAARVRHRLQELQSQNGAARHYPERAIELVRSNKKKMKHPK